MESLWVSFVGNETTKMPMGKVLSRDPQNKSEKGPGIQKIWKSSLRHEQTHLGRRKIRIRVIGDKRDTENKIKAGEKVDPNARVMQMKGMVEKLVE